MAEINNASTTNRHKTGKQCTKKSTKVDLTPMVDLGFLLITFFVFTTAMTRPAAMKMVMPKADGPSSDIARSKVLTVIPAHDNRVYYYAGELNSGQKPQLTNNGTAGIRSIILAKKKAVIAQFGKDEMKLIIKPADDCNYKNFVGILDEVAIDDVKLYFLDQLTAREKLLIKE
ncbi:MAG: biopolymer transporter ExbD [Bacteroidetes bacterium]|nr:biopolymer transporter ExbD [Bacteroidota bacterium]